MHTTSEDKTAGTCSEACDACVADCDSCHDACVRAVQECLKKGGAHLEVRHIGLLQDCAMVCHAAHDLLLRQSPFHGAICRASAEICAACATSCNARGDRECAAACDACAESCRAMSTATASATESACCGGSSDKKVASRTGAK